MCHHRRRPGRGARGLRGRGHSCLRRRCRRRSPGSGPARLLGAQAARTGAGRGPARRHACSPPGRGSPGSAPARLWPRPGPRPPRPAARRPAPRRERSAPPRAPPRLRSPPPPRPGPPPARPRGASCGRRPRRSSAPPRGRAGCSRGWARGRGCGWSRAAAGRQPRVGSWFRPAGAWGTAARRWRRPDRGAQWRALRACAPPGPGCGGAPPPFPGGEALTLYAGRSEVPKACGPGLGGRAGGGAGSTAQAGQQRWGRGRGRGRARSPHAPVALGQ